MSFKSGFSEIDITPPLGTKKGGWMEDLEARDFLDPLFARIAVFDNGSARIAFVQLDLLSVRWSDTDDLRKRISEKYDFPGGGVMVSATHNHAGPAISDLSPVRKQTAYLEDLKRKCVDCFGVALSRLTEAEIGYGSAKELEVAYNRRTVMRDGTVRTHGNFSDPDTLYVEGPMDPEVAVVTLKDKKGDTLGALVNFACHPTHHGGTNEISAGFPGVLASKMKDANCPVTLFLNGCYGNIATTDHRLGLSVSMEDAGVRLFEAVTRSVADVAYVDSAELAAVKENVNVPFRDVTDEEYHGKVRGAQRFRSDELYEKDIDIIIEKKKKYGTQLAEVQVLRLGEFYFASMPAEAFVEFQLRIKTETFPKHAVVVGGANGMVGYVPTKDAFARGGYETTLGPPSRMAPETGDIMTDKAIELILGI